MTASTVDRNSPMLGQGGRLFKLPLATAANIPAGVLVGFIPGTGASNAANTAGMRVVGRSTARATQATGGDTHVIAQAGVYSFVAAAALAAAGAAALWKDVYVVDNQTVGLASEAGGITSNRVIAGKLVQITDGRYYVAVALGLADGALSAEDVSPLAYATVSPAVTIGGMGVLIAIDLPDAATATYEYAVQEGLEIIDAWNIKDGAGAANTIQITDSADAAITNAMAAAVDKTLTRAGTIDKAKRTVAAGGTFKVVATRAAGTMAAQLFILARKV
jgi:hypothetical protein